MRLPHLSTSVSALAFTLGISGVLAGTAAAQESAFELQILHTNDHHSHLEGSDYDLTIDGQPVRAQLGGFARIATLIEEMRTPQTLVLNSGELNGTLYFSLFKGRADFEVFNALGLDAYQIGNHEFDEGEELLRELIDMASFPVLGGNVYPTEASPLHGADILPYIVKEVEGEKIGIVGVLKVEKTVESSMVTEAVEFSPEYETVREHIAALEAEGVNKIIVLSHLGYDLDQELAAEVAGIDVIIGGDTHELLDSTDEIAQLGLEVDGNYPTIVASPDGAPVYIAQAWEMAHGMGVLDVAFDADGNVLSAEGNIILPVEGPFRTEGEDEQFHELDEAAQAQVLDFIEQSQTLAVVEPSVQVTEILAPYSAELEEFRTQQIGTVAETLGFERIPDAFEAGETPTGSYAAYYVADSFLHYLPQADIAIQNSGGVRSQFLAGPFTVADAYTMLPFSNTLATVDLTGEQVVSVLEDAADYSLTSGSTGAFPYASHLRFDVDKRAPKGERILNVEVKDRTSGEWSEIDLAATYRVATNSFTALGRDGYDTFAEAIAADPSVHEDSHVAYAVPLIEYFQNALTDGELPVIDPAQYSLKSVRD